MDGVARRTARFTAATSRDVAICCRYCGVRDQSFRSFRQSAAILADSLEAVSCIPPSPGWLSRRRRPASESQIPSSARVVNFSCPALCGRLRSPAILRARRLLPVPGPRLVGSGCSAVTAALTAWPRSAVAPQVAVELNFTGNSKGWQVVRRKSRSSRENVATASDNALALG